MNSPRRIAFGAALALAACAGMVSAAETADSARKKISAKVKDIKSFSAKMKTVTTMDTPAYKLNQHSEGTFEYMVKGETRLSRSETDDATETNIAGNSTKTKRKLLSVMDGKFAYTLIDENGQKICNRMAVKPEPANDPFASYDEAFNMKLLPDETVDGKPCWVFELTYKNKMLAQQAGRQVHYYQQDSGVMVKAVGYGPDGKIASTTTISDVKLNPKLPEDHFAFKAPPGVEVQDLDKLKEPQPIKGDGKE